MPKVTPKAEAQAQALHFPETFTIPAGHWLLVYPDDTYVMMSDARLREYYNVHRPSGEPIPDVDAGDRVSVSGYVRNRRKPVVKPKIRRGAVWVRVDGEVHKIPAQQARVLYAMHEIAAEPVALMPDRIREAVALPDAPHVLSRLRDAVKLGYCEQEQDGMSFRLTDMGRTMAVAAIDTARTFLNQK